MEKMYRQFDAVALILMNALEVGFGIEDGSLVKRCIPSGTDLRLTHYPPIRIEDIRSGRTSRIAPHADFGVISLLFEDDVGGYEIEDRSKPGTFIPVPPTDT